MPDFIKSREEMEKQADDLRRLKQSQDDLAEIERLDEEFTRRVNSRRSKDSQWLQNLAAYNGNPYTVYDEATRRVFDLRPLYRSKSRVICNLIIGAVNDTLATLCQSDQKIEVIPASAADKDINDAKCCQIHLDRVDVINRRRLLDIALRWNLLVTGRGYRLVYYDFTRGEDTGTTGDPIPLKWKEGEMQKRTGEISEIICTPFELLFDYPAIQTDDDIFNFIRFRVVPIDWVRNNYAQGKYVEPEKNIDQSILSKYFSNNLSFVDGSRVSGLVILKEYYEEGSKKYPQGRLLQWANKVKLHDGVVSHDKGELGLFGYRWAIDTTEYYNVSYVEPLIGPQKEINRFKNKIQRWVDKILRFRLAVPFGGKISTSMLAGSDDGDIITYNPTAGVPVTHIPTPELHQSVFRGLEDAFLTFDRVAHLHEVSRGQAPGRVDSSSAIGRLQEAETRNLVVPMIHWEEQDCAVARFKLDLMRHYYPNEKGKEAKILGEMRSVEVYSLRGVDVSAGIDVDIIKGSAMPRSRLASNAWNLEMYKAGIMGPMGHPMVLRKIQMLLGYTGQTDTYGSVDISVNQQKQEMARMDKGEDVEVKEWHDHYTSNLVLLNVMQSITFKDKTPETQALYEKHWRKHADFILAMNQAPMPEAVQGTLQPSGQPQGQPSPGVAQLTGQPAGIPQQNPLQNIDMSVAE